MSALSPKSEVVSEEYSKNLEPNEDEKNAQSKRPFEFTSENHKLEISNLPSHTKYHLLKQFLERNLKIDPHKIRVGDCRAYCAFKSEEERNAAIAKINDSEWKGKVLRAEISTPRDPLVKRIHTDTSHDAINGKVEDEKEPSGNEINLQVCPLWGKDYEEQLKIKDHSMRSILNMGRSLSRMCPGLHRDSPKLHEWTQANKGLSCQFDGIVPSPIQVGYRNKCEFNIGSDGTVGFRLGKFKDGSDRVERPPDDCPIISECMFKVLDAFQAFLRDEANTRLRGYNHASHQGHFRQLTIRSNGLKECMLIIDLHPQDMLAEELDMEVSNMLKHLTATGDIISLYCNISEKNHLNGAEQTIKHISGKKYLCEYLEIHPDRKLKFLIGPTSFFQVNTRAAELLYRSIVELAQLDSKSFVLDVGCGTGTIALSFAQHVSYVIGIEIVKSAIEDAKINAKENGISNVSFFAGKAEDLISESLLIMKHKRSEQNNEGEIVAIVDPPRQGFNSSLIKHIRASNIKKIIYVACDPKANTNLLALCRPTSKAYQGDPFVPTRAKAFDLFPHTKYCELVIVYERLTSFT